MAFLCKSHYNLQQLNTSTAKLWRHGAGVEAHVWKEPYNHYHDSFHSGENTLNAQIARVLMRNMTMAKGRYDHETWC